jgi:hypothetical protein
MSIPKVAKHISDGGTFILDITHTEAAVILTLIDYNKNELFGNDVMEQRMKELEKRIFQHEYKMGEYEKISKLYNSTVQSKL